MTEIKLTEDEKTNLTNFVHNAAEVMGVTPAAISEIINARPDLKQTAIQYERPRLADVKQPEGQPQ